MDIEPTIEDGNTFGTPEQILIEDPTGGYKKVLRTPGIGQQSIIESFDTFGANGDYFRRALPADTDHPASADLYAIRKPVYSRLYFNTLGLVAELGIVTRPYMHAPELIGNIPLLLAFYDTSGHLHDIRLYALPRNPIPARTGSLYNTRPHRIGFPDISLKDFDANGYTIGYEKRTRFRMGYGQRIMMNERPWDILKTGSDVLIISQDMHGMAGQYLANTATIPTYLSMPDTQLILTAQDSSWRDYWHAASISSTMLSPAAT